MSTLFTTADYQALAAIVFRPDYPGNASARGIVEAPHGNGNLDHLKRYSHVAEKYLQQWEDPRFMGPQDYQQLEVLWRAYDAAHSRALDVATALGVPEGFWPSFEHSALRVLDYPPGATSALHTDFDLFTINAYRNVPNPGLPAGEVHMGELGELLGLGHATPHHVEASTAPQMSLVYFAIPDHAAVLPSGITVGAWIAERIARSRYEATK